MSVNTVITFVLLGAIATTTQVLNQLYRLIEASSDFTFALRLYAFLVPTVTVTILPVAFLIGVMSVYRAMEEDREAVIVAASGAPLSFVIKPALMLAAIVSVTVLLVSTLVEPLANREVRNSIALLTTDIAEYVASQGILTEIQSGLFVRGGTRSADGQIEGLFILDRRDPAQEIIYIAEGGRVAEDNGNLVLEMFGGSIHVRDTTTGRVHRFEFGRYMSSVPWFKGAEVLAYRPRETTTSVLITTHFGGTELGFQRSEARSELVRRFTDWLYPFAYLGVCAVVLMVARGNRFAYRWMMPGALVSGIGVKAIGLALIGSAGNSTGAVVAAFVLPLATAVSPLVLGAIRALPRALRA
jgi:lipopolysaccharide export system permease protein